MFIEFCRYLYKKINRVFNIFLFIPIFILIGQIARDNGHKHMHLEAVQILFGLLGMEDALTVYTKGLHTDRPEFRNLHCKYNFVKYYNF